MMRGSLGSMKLLHSIGSVALMRGANAAPASSQRPSARQRLPIIDMHVHAFGWDPMGNPPPPNIVTRKVPSARTDKEFMDAVLAELKRYNIVKAVARGPTQHV